MSGGLSALGLARAYARGREHIRRLNRERVDEMKANVVNELRKHRAVTRKNWKGSR
jgi:hypothetical protein